MTFEGIQVRHAALEQGAADVLRAARGIESRLDQLEADLGPLRGGWSGSAQQAYSRAKTAWDRAMSDMIVLLQDAGRGVESSNADYLAADRRGAGRF